MKVSMRVSRELLEQMFVLDGRRIVGVRFEDIADSTVEPTALVVFDIEAPDAPDGTTEMEPSYRREAGRPVTMLDPGWRA